MDFDLMQLQDMKFYRTGTRRARAVKRKIKKLLRRRERRSWSAELGEFLADLERTEAEVLWDNLTWRLDAASDRLVGVESGEYVFIRDDPSACALIGI